MPFFSVIIPLYNKAKHIKYTLDSVLAQEFIDYEIIVVDDGSTDDGLSIVQTVTDSRIRIIKQQNQGVSVARNHAAQNARGIMLAFLDADDYWQTNHLLVLYHLYQDFNDAGMYCSRYVVEVAPNKIYVPKLLNIKENYRGYVSNFFYSSFIDRVAWTSAVAIPRPVFLDIGGFNPLLINGQDLELWIRMGLKYKVAISECVTSKYHFEVKNSLSKKKFSDKLLIDFNDFKQQEIENPWLKKFLDIYRIEYALHYKIEGKTDKMNQYLLSVPKSAINIKTAFLLLLPSKLLQRLLQFKKFLNKKGVFFRTYH